MTASTMLRLPAVIARTGLSRPTIYRLMAAGQFPRSRKLSGAGRSAVGWLDSDIEAWITSCQQTAPAQARAA